MPRKSVEQGIGEVIKDLFKAYHIDDKVYAIRIGDVWQEVMGKTVARYTTGIRLEKDVLHIRIDSAPLRQELFFHRDDIRQRINQAFAEEVVREVHIR